MTTVTQYLPIGSVSHGTMRPEDLIPAFLEALDNAKESYSFDDSVPELDRVARIAQLDTEMGEIERRRESSGYYNSEDCHYDLEWLVDILSEFAPSYCEFCSHEGDGADYGCWPNWYIIIDDIHDGTLLKVDDMSDVPDDHTGDVIHVNDHGNATLYSVTNGNAQEVWVIV